MPIVEMYRDAYPEQLMAALHDELRRAEREETARAVARERRRARWAGLRGRLARRPR